LNQTQEGIRTLALAIQDKAQSLMKNEKNVQNLASASEKGRDDLHRVAGDIKAVATESERLLEINKVIQNIAIQTNLLAMNAAIEAAHAGDVGRGFAVVADEIRKLAESSSNQAKTVSSVLKEIKSSLEGISMSTEAVLHHFEDINTDVQTVSDLETTIRNATEEQDTGSKQILETIGVSNEITTNVRNGSAEMLSGSHEIMGTGKRLETMTTDLTGSVNEITAGMVRLNTTISRIQAMGSENKQSIEVLMAEISRFKL
jgi:methyl-accepting chemotaxis protein